MQHEIDAAHPRREVRILAINMIDAESGIPEMCQGRTLPVVQDDNDHLIWHRWNVTYRDVFILDPQNEQAGALNLTQHGLATQANYDSLRTMILEIANR